MLCQLGVSSQVPPSWSVRGVLFIRVVHRSFIIVVTVFVNSASFLLVFRRLFRFSLLLDSLLLSVSALCVVSVCDLVVRRVCPFRLVSMRVAIVVIRFWSFMISAAAVLGSIFVLMGLLSSCLWYAVHSS